MKNPQSDSTAGQPPEQHANQFGQPIGPPLPGWSPPPFPARESIEGRYCRLEPLEPEIHSVDLHLANSLDIEGRNWTYLPVGPFHSVEDYRRWMNSVFMQKDPMFFAIIQRGSEKPLGIASLMRITPAAGSIEVGHIHFSEKMKRSPVATEAMYLMMKKVFDLGYRRYEWKCDAFNAPSRAAAARFGFRYEGTFRNATVYKERSRDTAWFSIIDSEWPAVRKAFETWLDAENFDDQGKQKVRLAELMP